MNDRGTTRPHSDEPSYALHRAYLMAPLPPQMRDSPRIRLELDCLEGEGELLTDEQFQAASQAEKDRYLPPEKGWYLPQ